MPGVPSLVPGKSYTDITTVFNDPALTAKLQNYIDEAVRCKQRILDEQESIKGIRDSAIEELQIKPKLFNAMVSMMFNNDMEERLEELAQMENAINGLMQATGR